MDKTPPIDKKRRQFLVRATTAMGVIGAVAAGIPFVSSLLPTAKAKAKGGPVRVKVSGMQAGDQLTVIWQGRPVWIIKRSQAALDLLPTLANRLRDPSSRSPQQPPYVDHIYRSIRKDIIVLIGICTHLGCTPTFRPDLHSLEPDWPGGFFCSCHGSKFDLSGRVYKAVPAPINLEIPPHVYLNDDEILIGVDKKPVDLL